MNLHDGMSTGEFEHALILWN